MVRLSVVLPDTTSSSRQSSRTSHFFRIKAEEGKMTITPEQVKAGRRLLGWSRSDLGGHSGVSTTTIGKYETENIRASVLDLSVVRRALEAAGIEFTNGGEPAVKLSKAAQESGEVPHHESRAKRRGNYSRRRPTRAK
jgi:hypothetical protein